MYQGQPYSLSNFDAIWYRRGFVRINEVFADNCDLDVDRSERHEIIRQVEKFKSSELFALEEYINFLIATKYLIGSPSGSYLNKLIVLKLAQTVGMQIPETIVTSRKDYIKENLEKYGSVINKAINRTISIKAGRRYIFGFTRVFGEGHLGKLSNSFFPSLFQSKIEKRYEIRIFFLFGKSHAMAIFSQSNSKTNIDLRNYDLEKPNRCVPYKLPIPIEHKIKRLMKRLRLNSGSIDMIYTRDNKYVFIEVNPCGQFEMLSYNCNYYLEKEIAKLLTNGKK